MDVWFDVLVVPAGVGVVVTAVGLLLPVVVRRPWRVHARLTFLVRGDTRTAGQLIARTVERHRGWQLKSDSTPDLIIVRCRASAWSWAKELVLYLEPGGADFTLVHGIGTAPQLFDMGGDNANALHWLADRLAIPPQYGRTAV